MTADSCLRMPVVVYTLIITLFHWKDKDQAWKYPVMLFKLSKRLESRKKIQWEI